jgi:ADP-ribosylglycohydrolase
MNLSINHSGDCDSTGALTSNIMGLLLGIDSIPERWISNLKHVEFLQQVAADLYTELDKENLVEWGAKYPAY